MVDSQTLVKEQPIITNLDTTNFRKWPIFLLNNISDCIGKPYKYNCFDKSGFDCYTLIFYLYSLININLPKENIAAFNLKIHTKLVSRELVNFKLVKFINRQPFDIIIFEQTHLGMVLDYTTFIHVNFNAPVVIEYFKGNLETGFIRKIYRWNF